MTQGGSLHVRAAMRLPNAASPSARPGTVCSTRLLDHVDGESGGYLLECDAGEQQNERLHGACNGDESASQPGTLPHVVDARWHVAIVRDLWQGATRPRWTTGVPHADRHDDWTEPPTATAGPARPHRRPASRRRRSWGTAAVDGLDSAASSIAHSSGSRQVKDQDEPAGLTSGGIRAIERDTPRRDVAGRRHRREVARRCRRA